MRLTVEVYNMHGEIAKMDLTTARAAFQGMGLTASDLGKLNRFLQAAGLLHYNEWLETKHTMLEPQYEEALK